MFLVLMTRPCTQYLKSLHRYTMDAHFSQVDYCLGDRASNLGERSPSYSAFKSGASNIICKRGRLLSSGVTLKQQRYNCSQGCNYSMRAIYPKVKISLQFDTEVPAVPWRLPSKFEPFVRIFM